MRHWVFLALLLCLAEPASAIVCTSTSGGTWFGATASGGTATWDCAPTAAADFVIDHPIKIGGAADAEHNLGTSGAPLTGSITVGATGSITTEPGTIVYTQGGMDFQSGSGGSFAGNVIVDTAAPSDGAISYPSPTTIRMDFTEVLGGSTLNRMPFTLCDPSGAGTTCANTTVHPADTDAG